MVLLMETVPGHTSALSRMSEEGYLPHMVLGRRELAQEQTALGLRVVPQTQALAEHQGVFPTQMTLGLERTIGGGFTTSRYFWTPRFEGIDSPRKL